MRLVWSNCVKYNGATSPVGKVGVKGQNLFEQLWAGSGLSDEARTRRTTAGVAAPKYEPAAGVPEKKSKKLANGQSSKFAKRSSKTKVGQAVASWNAHMHPILRTLLCSMSMAIHGEEPLVILDDNVGHCMLELQICTIRGSCGA